MRYFDFEGFGLALSGRMKIAALTLREAGKQAGVTTATFYRAETGEPVHLQHAVSLAEWLTLPLDTFCRTRRENSGAE